MTHWAFRCQSCGHEQEHNSHAGTAHMTRGCDVCGLQVELAGGRNDHWLSPRRRDTV
jgi:transcription elongation factor Elf1